ncbi:MAG: hypothetical protein LBK07_00330 [Tannerella sp.]|jgi:hypothetical protein|nr:hypothetical protein [Tannerella sp.]
MYSLALLAVRHAAAQERLSLSGNIQTQFQHGERDATLKVGTANEHPDQPFSRVGIRRGRVKMTYAETFGSAVFQVDATEKGIAVKDAYLNLKEPWTKTAALRAGIFEPPFGNEIDYSSALRESPESSLLYQMLFPEERDMGVMLQLRPPDTSPLHMLMLDAALLAGNGANMETDSRRDFAAHLHAQYDAGAALRIAGGISCYFGSVYQGTETVLRVRDGAFAADDDPHNRGRFARREYRGVDLQLSMPRSAWARQLRAELISGVQPGSATDMRSRTASSLPAHDTYVRHFRGGYAIFVQDLARSTLAAVVKYEWLDPNTRIAGNDIGLNRSAAADILRRTFGFGMLWQPDRHFRLQAYYEINRNETSSSLEGYATDRSDNVFTLRLQYRF